MKILQFFFIFFTIHLLIPNSSIALTCSRNQWLSANGPSGKCESCPRNATCNGFSYRCLEGYSYSSSGPCALRCPTNCISCSTSTCYRCKSGYTLVNGQCQKPSCPSNCKTCSSGKCSACKDGYELQNNRCVSKSCPAGQFLNGTTCTGCAAGTYSDDGRSCKVCPDGTYAGNGAASCTKCPAGTYASGTGNSSCKTSTVVTNCSTYSKTENKCIACNSGFTLTNGQCVLQNTVNGSCPNGLSKSADGCCCVK